MNTNQETIKAAAKRMCEHLGAKGVPVKHTAMLEALAQGFGLDNWRTLKAVIDAPRAPAKKSKPLGQMQEWTVDALYRDNNQQYGDTRTARTPLEAAYDVIIERLTDCGLEVDVLNVSDADGECQLSPSFISEISLWSNRSVLETVFDLLEDVSKLDWTEDQQLAFAWLQALLKASLDDDLDELTDWCQHDEAPIGAKDPVREGAQLLPSTACELLLDLAEASRGGIAELERTSEESARQLHQLRAICGNFECVLNSSDHGGIALLDF